LRLLLGIGRAPDALLEVGEQIEEVLPNVPIKLILLDIFAHDLANVLVDQARAAMRGLQLSRLVSSRLAPCIE
jgi:hypothetical protein